MTASQERAELERPLSHTTTEHRPSTTGTGILDGWSAKNLIIGWGNEQGIVINILYSYLAT